MLASKNLLKGKNRVEEVKKKGNLFQSESFGATVIKRDDEGPQRFAFVISTKISKLAVHRNRIKRALGEAVRRNLKRAPKNIDVVFLAKKNADSKTTDELMKETEKFLSDLRL
jgi:ribonuclease P protein component